MGNKYYNRDLSWLLFDNRVIDQAYDKNIPLLERLRFLSIASNNADEFFGVRVHNVQSMIKQKGLDRRTGLNGIDLLSEIYEYNLHNLTKLHHALPMILEELKAKDIFQVTKYDDLSLSEREHVDYFYEDQVASKLVVKEFSPKSKATSNLTFLLCSESEYYSLAIPDEVERLVGTGIDDHYTYLEDVIYHNMGAIIERYGIQRYYIYRLTYDNNKQYDFLDSKLSDEEYLKKMDHYVETRATKKITRIEFYSPDGKGRSFFSKLFEVSKKSIFAIPGVLDVKFVDKLFKKYKHDPQLVFKPFQGLGWDSSQNILQHLDQESLLIEYPYDSFSVFLKFLETAVNDPKTTSIEMTIYRTEKNSQVVKLLKEAAQHGIAVTVVVELRARFDEAHNLIVADELEEAGCKILYGDRINKIHAKICLIRQGQSGYVQIGTGNYNAVTAKVFSDISFFTSKPEYVSDSIKFFERVAGQHPNDYQLLSTSPKDLKPMILRNIKKATEAYLRGEKAEVFIKANGLTDVEIIDSIYQSARLGLPFRFIVRGPCCLKLGICGPKEDIVVKSIVGELLEHSRIYSFTYGRGKNETWISSADLMTRNLDRRVEIAAPIVEEQPKKKIAKIIKLYRRDTRNSYYLMDNGEYMKKKRFFNISAQQTWLHRIKKRDYI